MYYWEFTANKDRTRYGVGERRWEEVMTRDYTDFSSEGWPDHQIMNDCEIVIMVLIF